MALLSRAELLELLHAEAAFARAKAELDRRKIERADVRDRILPRLPLGEWVEIFGVRLRYRQQESGERFSLSAMHRAGKKLPKHLLPFISVSAPTHRLDLAPTGDEAAELETLAKRVAAAAS